MWESQSLLSKGKCAWPQGFCCYVRGDCCFLKIYPENVHWCVTCCYLVWVQSDDDFLSYAHRSEGCGRPLLCHCGVLDPVFLCAECRGNLIGEMEDPTVVWKFLAFSVKMYILFLKDVCVLVLPFRSCLVLAGPHAKEKCACDHFADGCVQMCVWPLVDVENELFWYSFLLFSCWVQHFVAP